jgi:SAM-dependent methyltransferase
MRRPLKYKAAQARKADVFGDYAAYYELLYHDKDYAAEAGYVAGLIRRFHPQARSVLELGSGTGTHARLLAQAGFRVHGVERSPGMLARARAASAGDTGLPAGHAPMFTPGDIRRARLGRRFDACVALFHVLSYQTAEADVVAAFRTARRHLSEKGLFLFDVWYGPAVLSERPAVRVKRAADAATAVTRIAEPRLRSASNTVEVDYQLWVRDLAGGDVREIRESHAMRYFFLPEIEGLAVRCGFTLVLSETWLTGEALSESSWSGCFVLKAARAHRAR